MNGDTLIELATRKGEIPAGIGLGAQRARLRTLIEQATGRAYLHAGEAIDLGGERCAARLNDMPDIDMEVGF